MAEERDENTIAFDSLEEWCKWGWGVYDKIEVLVVLVARMSSCRYVPPGGEADEIDFYGPFLPDEVGTLRTEEGAHRELKAGGEAELCDHQLIGWFVVPADYSMDKIQFGKWNYLS